MGGGWGVGANGVISEFGCRREAARGEDMAGDLVIPGLVELHTDHIEAHYMPRPKVHWDPVSAGVSYDGPPPVFGTTTGLGPPRARRPGGAPEGGGPAPLPAPATPAPPRA